MGKYVVESFFCLIWMFTAVLPAFPDKPYAFTPVDTSQGLSDNKVRNIAQLPDGRMVITTEGQINLYDGTDFTYLHYGKQHLCGLSDYAGYNHVYVDANGYLWIKNMHLLMVMDIGNEQFVNRPDSLFRQWGITDPLKDLFVDKEDRLWVVTACDDLLCIERERQHVSAFMSGVSLGNDQLYDLGVVDGRLYLFYRSGMLVCCDLHTKKELYRCEMPSDIPVGYYGNTSYVVQGKQAFYQLCNGDKGGVMLSFDIRQRVWQRVMSTDTWFNYLSIDHDGSVWVSGPEGLCHLSSDLADIQYIPTLKMVDGQKIDTEVSTLYNDSQGGMWVGTVNRGILYYHPRRFRFRNIGKALFPVPEEATIRVTGFEEMSAGGIMVKTPEKNFLYHPVSGELSACQGTVPGECVEVDIPGLNERPLQTVAVGQDTLVGITRLGWFLFDRQSRKSTFCPAWHPCNAVAPAGKGRFWIGLEDGLVLWDAATGEERRFCTSDGLVNNAVRSIIRLSDGQVWISTANGISSLRMQESGDGEPRCSFVNFNRFDGVIANEFCEGSVFLASDGTLYWGGINGFNRLDTSSGIAGQMLYPPLFVGFSLFGEPVERGKAYHGNVILERSITQIGEISLRHDQNFFTIEFSAMNYVNPAQTYYRYQLEGVDKSEREIHSAGGKGSVTYTDLPPGNYLFRVRAAGNNGESWNEQYAELRICVKAPCWQTGYAYALYLTLGTACVFFSLFLYIRSKKRHLIREQKEKLDEMKTLFLQNINRELEEPIKKMLSPLDFLLKRTDEGRNKQQLQSIQKNVMELQSLVGQLSEGVLLPLPADESLLNLDRLLIDMRRLLEQQEKRKNRAHDTSESRDECELLSEADEAFIRKALRYVECNLDDPEYSVEALSRDMGMERTGLYRRLVAMVGKSPTSFIRSIRLKSAAQLLEKGYTVAEVADKVGFSTSSYFCKCFQEEFGMRPLQYVQQLKKS